MEVTGNADVDAGVPTPVRALVARHLREMDRSAPGLIAMLYLTGSVTLDDYRPGVSDVDFLVVTSRPMGGADLAAVASVHRQTPAVPCYDGIYLDRASFDAMLDDGQVVPHVVDGVFHTARACGELNPVLWLMLTKCGFAVRGPATTGLGLRVDQQRLRRWNLDNLTGYWRPLAEQIRQAVAGRADDAAANPVGVVWAVLGPARLHYTLATADVTSKSGAGRYAARRFTAWADLIERTISWRDGRDGSGFVTTDALAAAAMVDAVVDDAHKRWG